MINDTNAVPEAPRLPPVLGGPKPDYEFPNIHRAVQNHRLGRVNGYSLCATVRGLDYRAKRILDSPPQFDGSSSSSGYRDLSSQIIVTGLLTQHGVDHSTAARLACLLPDPDIFHPVKNGKAAHDVAEQFQLYVTWTSDPVDAMICTAKHAKPASYTQNLYDAEFAKVERGLRRLQR
jgi:hypothetical protein